MPLEVGLAVCAARRIGDARAEAQSALTLTAGEVVCANQRVEARIRSKCVDCGAITGF